MRRRRRVCVFNGVDLEVKLFDARANLLLAIQSNCPVRVQAPACVRLPQEPGKNTAVSLPPGFICFSTPTQAQDVPLGDESFKETDSRNLLVHCRLIGWSVGGA